MKLPNLPGRGESEEEKQKRQYEDKMMIQDSVQTSSLEKKALSDKEDAMHGSNELLNPEKDKQRIKQLLLNVKPVEVRPKVLMCDNCGTQYTENVEECRNCEGNEFKVKQGQPQIQWQSLEGEQLINAEGFNKVVWSEVESAINVSVSGGYLSSSQIAKLNYATLSTITIQLGLYWYRYGVKNPSDMQQIADIIRHPLLANTSKARGGRGLRNQESTRVEKLIGRYQDNDDGGDDNDFLF